MNVILIHPLFLILVQNPLKYLLNFLTIFYVYVDFFFQIKSVPCPVLYSFYAQL